MINTLNKEIDKEINKEINKEKQDKGFLEGFNILGITGFFLAVAPIFDPYILGEIAGNTIRLNDIFVLLLGGLCFLKRNGNYKTSDILVRLLIGLALISVFGVLFSKTNMFMAAKNLIVWSVYAVLLMFIWQQPCREQFFKWVRWISYFVVVIALLQFVLTHMGIEMWGGKIPWLQISEYDNWKGLLDPSEGRIRICSVFQEPSYVAIYLMVSYAHALKEERLFDAVLFLVTMLITTSFLAFVGIGVITLYILLNIGLDISKKTRGLIFMAIAIAIIAAIVLAVFSPAVRDVVDYFTKRAGNFINELTVKKFSSANSRVLGYSYLFKEYSSLQKLIGVGIAQYAPYFGISNAYSSVFVTTLLNSGLLGLGYLLYCFYRVFRAMKKEDWIFIVIFIMIMSVDYQWFSWYFFYLLSACVLKDNK